MFQPADAVVLDHAPSSAIAQMWQSALEEAGIPAYVAGTFLADEYAASQRLMGTMGTRVLVRSSDLERARALVATLSPPAAGSEPAKIETRSCPNCNTPIEQGFQVCWRCSTELPESN